MTASEGWQKVKIGQIGRVVTGKTPPTKRQELYGDKYPFITQTDISEGYYKAQPVRFLSEEGHRYQKRYLLPKDTVCYTCIASIGKICMTTEPSFTNQQINSIIVDSSNFDYRFIYHLLRYETERIRALASGAAAPIINKSAFSDIELLVPPLPIQRKIAAILSAYDDLIENNTRRIAILEEMAQALYREWFVHFRFPGHEQVAMVDSELGLIPEGWERIGYSELLESYLGGGWGLEEPSEKETRPVVVIRGTDFDDVRLGNELRAPIRYITESSLEKRRLQEGDVVVENSVNASSRCVGSNLLITRGTLNRIGMDTIAASFCKVFRPHDPEFGVLIHLHLKYLYGEGRMEFYQHVATNGIGNFQARRFVNSEAMPLPKDVALLAEMIGLLKDLTTSNYAERNANLRRTRDLLLPRLISGEVDVSELEINTGGLDQ